MQILVQNKAQIAAIALLAIFSAVLINYILFGIAAVMLLLIYFLLDKEVLVPSTILAFLIFTSDVSETLRLILTLLITAYLTNIYIKDFGISVDFKTFPKNILIVFLLLFTGFLVSSILNGVILSGIWFIVKSTFFLFLVYLYVNLSTDKIKMQRLYLIVLVISAIILSFTIFYDFYQHGIGFLISNVVMRYGGIYSNINAAGVLISTSIPVVIYFVLTEKLYFKKILYLSLFGILSVALLLTNSRSSILAAVVSILILTYILKKDLLKKIFTYGFLALAILLIFTPIYDLISTVLRFERIVNTRSYIWDITFDIIRNHFLIGVGPGQFPNYIYKYLPVMLGTWDEVSISFVYEQSGLGHAHNFFLFYFSELGLIGLLFSIAFPIIIYKLVFNYLKLFRNQNLLFEYGISALAISVLTGAIARGLFESIGIFSYGWIERDLPLWVVLIVFLSSIKSRNYIYDK